jgi:23S rRNA (uracil1939-C5)-methyltransferase
LNRRILAISNNLVTLSPAMPNSPPFPESIEIQRIAPGGDGIGRLSSGEAIFVRGSARGDRVEIQSARRQHGVLIADRFHVLEEGSDRRHPRCPYFEQCGGCDFMHLTPDAQRREKLAIFDDALSRVGGDPARPSDVTFVHGTENLAYRARVRLHVDQHGTIGYHSERSNRLVPINLCVVANPLINDAIARLCSLSDGDKKRLSFCSEIELRVSPEAPTLAVRMSPRKGVNLRSNVYAPLFQENALVVVTGTPEDNERTQSMPITEDITLSVPVAAFSQVYPEINQKLIITIVTEAVLRQHKTFLDAYAGAGNFAIPLLKAGLIGEAVDQSSAGILAARSTARQLGLPFTGFSIGNAKTILEQFVKNKRTFDYLVLDPPRRGAKDVLDTCLKLRPRTIALIGCDPVAFARDLGKLVQCGGVIEKLSLFDMFPETHHFESLAIVDMTKHYD